MHWKITLIIAALLASMTGAALYYRALYLNAEKDQQYWEAQAKSQQAALEQLHRQMQTVAALDTKHTRELEHDKKRIAQLERDVADGRRRLQVRAVCPRVSASGPATRMDDATRARLDDTAQGHYFTLRRRIEIAEAQINGLQDYVRHICLTTAPARVINQTGPGRERTPYLQQQVGQGPDFIPARQPLVPHVSGTGTDCRRYRG